MENNHVSIEKYQLLEKRYNELVHLTCMSYGVFIPRDRNLKDLLQQLDVNLLIAKDNFDTHLILTSLTEDKIIMNQIESEAKLQKCLQQSFEIREEIITVLNKVLLAFEAGLDDIEWDVNNFSFFNKKTSQKSVKHSVKLLRKIMNEASEWKKKG